MSSLLQSLDFRAFDLGRPSAVDIAQETVLRFSPNDWEGDEIVDSVVERAESLDNERDAALACAGELIAALAVERPWEPGAIHHIVERIADVTALPADEIRLALFREALGDPRLASLPPGLSIQTSLRLLLAFAPVAAASFWVVNPARSVRCAVRIGAGARRMRTAAEEAVRSGSAVRGAATATAVRRWQHVAGVVAAHAPDAHMLEAATYVRETARMLGPALERESLLDRGTAREHALVATGERRLARLGYDLHDGPLQDVGAARRELFLLRDELARLLGAAPQADAARAHLERLDELVTGGELRLRQLAQSAESPAILSRPLRTSLEAEITSFVAASDIEADVRLEGDLDSLTGSQRIALVRIVQEALSNIREHSGATRVRLSVVRSNGAVRAEISDDGRGFELERTLVRAAKRGRMGLVGMSERALLLGGAFDVLSAPGGPTRIAVTLPEWRPLDAANADQPSEENVLWA